MVHHRKRAILENMEFSTVFISRDPILMEFSVTDGKFLYATKIEIGGIMMIENKNSLISLGIKYICFIVILCSRFIELNL